MNAQDLYVKRVEELMDGIDKGAFAEPSAPPEAYRYGHLAALFYFARSLEHGEKLYEQLYERIISFGTYHIKRKTEQRQKIKIAFLSISAAEWASEDLYRRLAKDERLECYVVVCPLMDRERESRRKTEAETRSFFEQNHYDVRRIYDAEEDICQGWEAVGGLPDIVMHSTPWYHSLPEPFQIENFPLHILNCYIPYGLYVADNQDRSYAPKFVYNKEFVNLQWKIYADSELNLAGYKKYELLHGKNISYSGYVKMDFFQKKRDYTTEELQKIWKFPQAAWDHNPKRLIIAPHHSLEETAVVKYATFEKNAWFWLYLAQKYQDQISFIFKPHPNLRWKAAQSHLFQSSEEYDAYLDMWNALPNAKVVEEGSYLDIFATSDGMIMDSASFLGEYMYADKPLLFLIREEQAFNSLGERLILGYHQVKGEDYMGIEQFVEHVILKGQDSMAKERRRAFGDTLDYKGKNGCPAVDFIVRDLLKLMEG